MYNKSEIMKSAWNLYKEVFRSGKRGTFAVALKQAWASAKAARAAQKKIGYVMVDVLSVGDTIQLHGASKVITAIEPAGLGFAGTVVRFNDGDLKCFTQYVSIQRVAVA